MDMQEFLRDRNEALFSLDEKKIRKYCQKYGVVMPENERVFWAGVYKSILAIPDSPSHLRRKAENWLDSHGFKRTIC